MNTPRVLAVATHPIQYQAPWFRALGARVDIDFSVLFLRMPDAREQGQGFGVAFEWDVPLVEGYAWRHVPMLDESSRFFTRSIARARQLLRELRPDVLLLTGWHASALRHLLVAASRERIPVLMRGDSNALRPRPAPVRWYHRWLLGQCSACLPVGRSNRDFYRSYGVPAERLFDVPHFVDNARFHEAARQARRDELRAQWQIPAGVTCFGYAGKFEAKKRILDLLDAVRIARDGGARLHLLVVGDGALMPRAQAFAKEHALPVTFAGFLNQSQIADAYAAMDCLVLPSDFGETWGLVVNEAMACARPAIVSDRVGCGPDLVTPGETGEVFPFGDVPALAARLTAFASSPARLLRMGEAARERVLAHYSVERAVQGTLAAVRHVVRRA